MHNVELIMTLTGGFIGALGFGYLTHRLGWSPIVGYLLAGIVVGPHTPGFVADRHLSEQLAEVGVILLMFGVGLHFKLKDLAAVKGIAIVGALVQSAVATGLGAIAFHAFGWNWSQGVVFGLALSVASTVVLVRVLSDSGRLQSPTGRISVGWLVVEDIFTVFVLVLLPVMFSTIAGPGKHGLAASAGIATVKLSAFIVFTLFAGSRLVPWLLNKVAETRSRELFTLSVLAVALGIAAGSAYFFDVSMALGAFLAGMVVGQSEFSARAGSEALPMRDAFAVMFFLSVGMLFDPRQALESPLLIVVTTAIVMIGKPLAALAIVTVLGYGSKIALGVALVLSQVGEFSFLLASLGRQLGVLPDSVMNPVVAAAIISIMLNPVIYRWVDPIERYIERHPRLWRALNRRAAAQTEGQSGVVHEGGLAHRAVIVGYGPIGQLVCRILLQHGIEPTVIEMNIETHRRLRGEGKSVVYGDANRREVLEQAGIVGATSLILSASGTAGATEAVRMAHEINPHLHVVARADYLREAKILRDAGASEVFSGEGEVAVAIADSILSKLGATPGQLDETRARIRLNLQSSNTQPGDSYLRSK
ncbi:MAG TPA: cation:proton antiporter [Bryobacteraceae bacterium]|nr:cation:proton antiporter [Bryobacteraceae bacterium]HPT24787.1 cation:proton antiporter [Bryobacteraceae bacterium]